MAAWRRRRLLVGRMGLMARLVTQQSAFFEVFRDRLSCCKTAGIIMILSQSRTNWHMLRLKYSAICRLSCGLHRPTLKSRISSLSIWTRLRSQQRCLGKSEEQNHGSLEGEWDPLFQGNLGWRNILLFHLASSHDFSDFFLFFFWKAWLLR